LGSTLPHPAANVCYLGLTLPHLTGKSTNLPAIAADSFPAITAHPFSNPPPQLPMSLPTMTPDEKIAYEEALNRIETCRWGDGTVLDLSRLGLSHLPPEIGQLTALTELYLLFNQLATLPPEIDQLTALTELHLHANSLLNIPESILGRTDAEIVFESQEFGRPQDILGFYFAHTHAQAAGNFQLAQMLNNSANMVQQ
jgi:hypothetical protein